jgi:hypothetical protein
MAKTPQNNPAQAAFEDGKRRQAAAVAETERLTSQSTPTPTQEENDKAKLGLLSADDEKQDDGSGPDPVASPPAEGDDNDPEKVDRRRREYRTRVSSAE